MRGGDIAMKMGGCVMGTIRGDTEADALPKIPIDAREMEMRGRGVAVKIGLDAQ